MYGDRSYRPNASQAAPEARNFNLFALGSDTLSDRSSFTSVRSKSANGINMQATGTRRIDMNQLTNNLDKKRKVMVATNVYNDGINVYAPIIIHYGLSLYRFNNVNRINFSNNTSYGHYMRRIGRLYYRNGLSINLIKDVPYEKDAFRDMMQYFKIKYVNLDQIIEKRQNNQDERKKKWNVNELAGYNYN